MLFAMSSVTTCPDHRTSLKEILGGPCGTSSLQLPCLHLRKFQENIETSSSLWPFKCTTHQVMYKNYSSNANANEMHELHDRHHKVSSKLNFF